MLGHTSQMRPARLPIAEDGAVRDDASTPSGLAREASGEGSMKRMDRGALGVLLVAAALTLGGCSNGPTSTMEELGQDANTWGFGRRFPQAPGSDEFSFGVGDAVEILSEDLPQVAGPHVVRGDGRINLYLLNDVLVAGLTPDQVREKLVSRFAAYLREPEKIQVSVGEVQSKRYFIVSSDPQLGGTLIRSQPYIGDVVLLDVFAAMPPLTALLDDCHVKVIRGDPYEPRVLTINLREIYTLGATGGNIQIQPDDIIYVPPTLLGHLAAGMTAISLPFQGIFRMAQTAGQLDYTVRLLSGQNTGRIRGGYGGGFSRRRVF